MSNVFEDMGVAVSSVRVWRNGRNEHTAACRASWHPGAEIETEPHQLPDDALMALPGAVRAALDRTILAAEREAQTYRTAAAHAAGEADLLEQRLVELRALRAGATR